MDASHWSRGASSALPSQPAATHSGGERIRGSISIARHVPRAAGGGTVGRTPLLHFLYTRSPLGQYIAPDWAPPLVGPETSFRSLGFGVRVYDLEF